jgi:hypothetical protein
MRSSGGNEKTAAARDRKQVARTERRAAWDT